MADLKEGASSALSVLSAACSALGFELTDTTKGVETMKRMANDFASDSTMTPWYIDGMVKLYKDLVDLSWYIPGKILQWVQSWLADNNKGGAYAGDSTHYTTFEFPHIIGTANIFDAPLNTVSTFALNDKYVLELLDHYGISYNTPMCYKIIYYSETLVEVDVVLIDISKELILGCRDTSIARFGLIGFYCYSSDKYTYKLNTALSNRYRRVNTVSSGLASEGSSSTVPPLEYTSTSITGNGDWANTVESARVTFGHNIGFASFKAGGGVSRGGGVGRHSLPQDENFPPCGGPTSVEELNTWTERVINWNGECYLPLTLFKTSDWNDPEVEEDDPLSYIEPNMNQPQADSQTGSMTEENTKQADDNFESTTNGGNNLPTSTTAGFITLWHPSSTQLDQLGSFLNGQDFFGTAANILGSPMNNIVSLAQWPMTPVDGNSANPTLGGVGTSFKIPLIANQYQTLDCGSITITPANENEQTFMDYEPYTRVYAYLPFVGVVKLSTNDVTNSTLHLVYNVDFLTGTALAQIFRANIPIYEYPANVCAQIPITSTDASNLLVALAGAVGTAVTGSAMGSIQGGKMGARMTAFSSLRAAGEAAGGAVNMYEVSRSGNLAGNVGLLGELKPYIIIYRSRAYVPDNYGTLKGLQCVYQARLSTLSGFTVVSEVHVENMTATDTEKQEIERLLKEGVIL